MKLPVFKAFGTTFAMVFGHFIEFFKILWLPLAALMALAGWMVQRVFSLSTQILDLSTNAQHPDPHAMLQQVMPMLSFAGLIFLAEIIFIPMIMAGILRYVIRGEKANLGIAYLHYGGDELRILITFILQMLLFLVIYILGAIAIGLLVAGLGSVSAQAPIIGGIVGGIVLAIFMIWVCLRLSLALPAAVGAKKIGIGPSWSVTKGNVWRLLGYWTLWCIVWWVVEAILITVLMPGYFHDLAALFQATSSHAGDVEATRQAVLQWQQQFMGQFAGRMPLIMGVGFVVAFVLYPLLIGSGGVAYRLMTEMKQGDTRPAV